MKNSAKSIVFLITFTFMSVFSALAMDSDFLSTDSDESSKHPQKLKQQVKENLRALISELRATQKVTTSEAQQKARSEFLEKTREPDADKKTLVETYAKRIEEIEAENDANLKRHQEIPAEVERVIIGFHQNRTNPLTASSQDIHYPSEVESPESEKIPSTSSYTIKTPVPNKASQKFYASPVPSSNLWFGMELLTPENIGWWRHRLG